MVAAAMAGGLSGAMGAVSGAMSSMGIGNPATATRIQADLKRKMKEVEAKGYAIDFSAYKSERSVKEGQRQENWKDISKRGELSGENWGQTFNVNYAAITKDIRETGMGIKHRGNAEQWLYKGFQSKYQAEAHRTQKAEYGPGFSNEAVDLENKRRQTLVSGYEKSSHEYFTKYQAEYNKRANILERTERSNRRVALRERYQQMQITSGRGEARTSRASAKRGIRSLVVGITGTGLGIPR